MDVAGLVVGLSGLVAVFETSCKVWRTIRAASGFGDDVADSIRKLEMEFFRFYTWWDVLRSLELQKTSLQGHQTAGVPKRSEMMNLLSDQMKSPVVNAAESILAILVSVEHLLQEQGVLAVLNSQSNVTVPVSASTLVTAMTEGGEKKKKNLGQDLMAKVSWWKRVKYDAAPWRETNKESLSKYLIDMNYWNNSLYDILPTGLRESVLRQGISAYLLVDPEEFRSLAMLQGDPISQQAQFNRVYMRLLSLSFTDTEVQNRLLADGQLDLSGTPGDDRFSVVQYRRSRGAPSETTLVEWYTLPNDNSSQTETRRLIRERLAKMSLLLAQDNRPDTLRALDCLGCTESPPGQKPHRFGLVSRLPLHAQKILASLSGNASTMTLHDMLSRKQIPGTTSRVSLPTLAQRFHLAASMAQTLYTFMLADWHHKLFNSLNIMFLPVTKTSNSTAATALPPELSANSSPGAPGPGPPGIASPFICGFSISRPSAPEEISISGTTSVSEAYLHPDLRVNQTRNRPRYTMRYEVYALGLLLAEIGFWQPVHKLVRGSSSSSSSRQAAFMPDQFHQAVVAKCRQDLACWMGEEYAAVALRCLEVNPDSPLSREKTAFYWTVIWQLDQCAERMKLFTPNLA